MSDIYRRIFFRFSVPSDCKKTAVSKRTAQLFHIKKIVIGTERKKIKIFFYKRRKSKKGKKLEKDY